MPRPPLSGARLFFHSNEAECAAGWDKIPDRPLEERLREAT
jgi:hypothetical protein